MEVTEKLDALRSDLPGCGLVAYTDLGSQLVLSTSASAKPAQEEIDKLSELAQVMLDGAIASGVTPLMQSADADASAGVAMLVSESDAKVFLRAPGGATEALVCVCAPDIDLRLVIDRGRAALADIGAGG